MEEDNRQVIKFYKKRIEPFIAIAILCFIVTTLFMLYQEHQLKKEINENCGWTQEDYRCYCDFKKVQEIEAILETDEENFPDLNFTVGDNGG